MGETPVFLRRSLCTMAQGGFRCLDALRWDTPLGSNLRFTFGRGTDPHGLIGAGQVRLGHVLAVGGGALVSASAPAGQGPVTLGLGGAVTDLQTAAPEPELFDDLNVLAGLRHGEPAAAVADWLRYHIATHGLQGAVLFDRTAPGPGREVFAHDLQQATAGLGGLMRLVLVDAALPLGPAEAEDPWHAPMAELLLYDILKWRFLSRAGAVATLDPADLLAPPDDGIGLFSACRQSHTGLIPLHGQTVFPWHIRKGAVPVFGDHICRSAPAVPAPTRWCVAPRRSGPENLWLTRQVAGLGGIEDEIARYDHHLLIRTPGARVQDVTRKQFLSEDPALLRRARDVFGHKPVRGPKPATLAPADKTGASDPPGRTAVVTCMKNEGPFILEWLAYHRAIGVDDVLVYTNDCTDGTDRLLDLLAARGLVQRRDNPVKKGGKPQATALRAASEEPVVRNADWLICMDVDEFINIHVGDGRLADLYAAVGNANMISLTWRLFGNADRDDFKDGFVIDQFTRCAPQLIRRPHQAWGFKTLFRNKGYFEGFGVHRPRALVRGAAGHVRWVNGSGQPMPASFLKGGWRSGIDSFGYDLVTLNHYSVRSVESFLVKRDRGRVNHVARDQGSGYWFRMNNNDQQDRSILSRRSGMVAEHDRLMADPALAAAHADCVAAHRARIAQLRALPEYDALYTLFASDRMKRLSRMHRHFGMNVFLRGPAVIPDRVLQDDLPADFFFNTTPHDGKAAE